MKLFEYSDTRYDVFDNVAISVEHGVCIEAKDAAEADKLYREETGQRRIPKYIKRFMIGKAPEA